MGETAIIHNIIRTLRNGVTNTDITVDPGGGANITEEQFQPTGTDSQPLPGDYVIGVSVKSTGRKTAIAFLDPANAPQSGPGEHRTYSRDSSGTPVTEIWLKNDGSIMINNDNGFINITAAGIIELNGNADFGVRFNALEAGFNTLKTELNAFITVYNSHVHGASPGTSAPATPAAATISAAKIDEVKVP